MTQPELDLIYFTDEQLAAIIEAWAAEKKNEKDT